MSLLLVTCYSSHITFDVSRLFYWRRLMAKDKGHILVIDDDPDMVVALSMPLEANGYKVSHVGKRQSGLEDGQGTQARSRSSST